jgi:hypothetical protein
VSGSEGGFRALTTGLRRLLFVASGLVALAGFQLFVLTDHTNSYFSWTIAPGATAAFLGGGYIASFFLENLAARRRVWVDVRHTIPPVLTFTVLTEVATLAHVGKFHFHEQLIWAGLAAWIWLDIYTLVPIAFVILLPGQLRIRAADPPRRAPMPRAAGVVLSAQAAVLAVVGVLLFADPVRWTSIWPWPLTPLTGQAAGAWLLGIAVGLIVVIREADLIRTRPGIVAYALFGTFELLAVARYASDIAWDQVQSWIFLAMLVSIALVGWLGVIVSNAALARAERMAA